MCECVRVRALSHNTTQMKSSTTITERESWLRWRNNLVDLPALKRQVIQLGKMLDEFALSNAHRGQLLGCFARALSESKYNGTTTPSPMCRDVPSPLMIEGPNPFQGIGMHHSPTLTSPHKYPHTYTRRTDQDARVFNWQWHRWHSSGRFW